MTFLGRSLVRCSQRLQFSVWNETSDSSQKIKDEGAKTREPSKRKCKNCYYSCSKSEKATLPSSSAEAEKENLLFYLLILTLESQLLQPLVEVTKCPSTLRQLQDKGETFPCLALDTISKQKLLLEAISQGGNPHPAFFGLWMMMSTHPSIPPTWESWLKQVQI